MLHIADYDYFLPKELIAQKPASPRDYSKLLVYNTKTDQISLDRFYNFDRYLPKKSFLVLNNTKVIPARITLYKSPQGLALQGGRSGKVKALFFVNEMTKAQNYQIRGYVDRKIKIGDRLYFDRFHYINAMEHEGSIFTFQLNFPMEKLFELLEKKGTMPVPLYIKNTPLNEHELREKYQTVFARVPVGTRLAGSAAAPTASLHFTNRLFDKLEKKGIKKYFVTLHIGLGTFAPINEENLIKKKLHEEFFEIDRNTWKLIETNRDKDKKLVAVGTTVTRTLEAFANSNVKTPIRQAQGKQMSKVTKTDLFIFPPYQFKLVDCLITNFHLPKSSLMMLVEAFLQHKKSKKHLIDLYKIAINNNFRFYSFGDAMLII